MGNNVPHAGLSMDGCSLQHCYHLYEDRLMKINFGDSDTCSGYTADPNVVTQ